MRAPFSSPLPTLLQRFFPSFFLFLTLVPGSWFLAPVYAQTNVSYTVPSSGTEVISEWGACRLVTNNHASGKSIMVPTKYNYEWLNSTGSFLSSTVPGVTTTGCIGGALRFRSANSNYLNRTPGSTGNRQTFTFSTWVKRASFGSAQFLLDASAGTGTRVYFDSSDKLHFDTAGAVVLTTTPVYRDPSAWYHVVLAVDTTQATAANRQKMYVNGVQVTAFDTNSPPTQNTSTDMDNTSAHNLGRNINNSSNFLEGYMADTYLIDGQALTPTSFAQTNATTGRWEPKPYTGTYGTNGFHLDFNIPTNSATGIGKDTSGNGNNWTPNNFSTTGSTNDSVEDNPSLADNADNGRGNYPTFNPLQQSPGNIVFSNGNLTATFTFNNRCTLTNTAISSGKWYFEVTGSGSASQMIGATTSATPTNNCSGAAYMVVPGRAYASGGTIYQDAATTHGAPATYTTGDIVGVAIDGDAGTISWYKNGVFQITDTIGAGTTFIPFVGESAKSGNPIDLNFGQHTFSYTPPSGYKALNTYNMPTPAVVTPSAYMSVTTYTGNGYYVSVGNPPKLAGTTQISASLRFQSANTAYLSRSLSSSGSGTTWTMSMWAKRAKVGTGVRNGLFATNYTGAAETLLMFQTDDTMDFECYASGGSVFYAALRTNQKFVDTSAWHHIVMTWDTNNGTQTDRARLYVDGKRITSFSGTPTYPTSGASCTSWNQSGFGQYIGTYPSLSSYFDGYLADAYFVDGQALTPSSFGAYDANGNWAPKAYTGSYGNNGFHLLFNDKSGTTATTLGADSSGNGNNWTPNNFSVTPGYTDDVLRDTPTPYTDSNGDHGNFATLNPLFQSASAVHTLGGGNLDYNSTNTTSAYPALSGFVATGPVYFEAQLRGSPYSTFPIIGMVPMWNTSTAINGYTPGDNQLLGFGYKAGNGAVYIQNTSVGTYSSAADGDIINFAYDPSSGKVWVGKNGTWFNSGNPAAGTGNVGTITTNPQALVPSGISYHSANFSLNFGQRPFSYTPPTGFKTLSTVNAPSTTFTPDLVIIKDRTSANSWGWYDSARGATLELSSNSTGAQTTQSTGLLSFQNGGFTVGSEAALNTSGNSYVAYMFKKGVTPGFDIETYTGNGGSGTRNDITHNLGVAPSLVIIKDLSSATNWPVYHQGLTSTNYYTLLSTTAAKANYTSTFISPDSSTLTLAKNSSILNTNGDNYVAYLFAEVPGFSKFGSYTGNGSSTDGPFIYTGFRPAFIMRKRTDSTGNWTIVDDIRSPANKVDDYVWANLSNAELANTTAADIDFLSNGFKVRSTATDDNASGGTYIYAAFAEAPFKYANAR
ncbi:MAG: hypothetical protein GC129_02210 [Proteobacteria bacterium]|nr:hypothetical protein [Pseudomonadota bacterium]